MKSLLLITGLVLSTLSPAQGILKPWTENSGYWEYKGEPVLLIGGTINDNLFQVEGLKPHLDSLAKAGGNYVRNTMSDRDKGDTRAFYRNPDGKYDLGKWNDEYWDKFENLLKLANRRDIIVQIEIWDRFDHSRQEWLGDPYNPKNNINYSYEEAGLAPEYPDHPGRNVQPFFFTVPALDNNELLLNYQKAFVDKLLSISLKYNNVLYCIDNETSGKEEWALYWSDYVLDKAGEKEIYVTEMWDNWDVKSGVHKRTIDHPERYGYIDISQNTHIVGHENWVNSQYVLNYIKDNPRPVNSTKIYGKDGSAWEKRGITSGHAVQTFFRNLVGGFASSRFHRPPHGMGLSPMTINCIKTIRNIESVMKFWDIVPRPELLHDCQDGEAYLAAEEGESYLVYFPGTGEVKLDLQNEEGTFILIWVDVATAEWKDRKEVRGGKILSLWSRDKSGSFALLKAL